MDKPLTTISLTGLSSKEAVVYLFETAKTLGWRIRFISDAGLIAYTDNGEFSWNGEVTVTIKGEAASIKCVPLSAMVNDFGHADNAVKQYVTTFQEVKGSFTDDEIRQLYKDYEKDFMHPYEDTLKPNTRPEFSNLTSFWSYFKPSKNYFFTPIIVLINVLIYIIMVCSGMSVFDPDAESMLGWGANSTITTLTGQWWRLLTSCFIHFGLIHLLLNMYALVFVGFLLEPFVGKTKFIVAYILTGIAASIISLWWHDYTVSAGASGAIFGLYGVFLAILSTNHIERSMRNGLLANIGMFVIYNLVYGSMKHGIDNAAHIGGLLSGIVVGFMFLPALRKPDNGKLNNLTIAGTIVIVVIGSIFACAVMAGNDRVVYFKRMESFYKLEEKAIKVVEDKQNAPAAESLPALKQGMAYWEQGVNLMRELDRLELSQSIHQRNGLLIKYCRLRVKSYQLMQDAVQQDISADKAAVQKVNQQIRQVLDELSAI